MPCAALNFQPGHTLWTTSKPCATQSTQASSAALEAASCASASGGGEAFRPMTISGSSRGSASRAMSALASVPSSSRSVVSHTGPQIGCCTPYRGQIVRLVKPIFQPT